MDGLAELSTCAQVDVDFLDDVDGQAHGAGLVHQSPLDGLADPPSGIGRKTIAEFRIELAHCVDQPQIAFLDQVEQGQATIEIAAGDLDHQAQIAFDHPRPGFGAALLGLAGKENFFFGGQ